MTPVVRLTLAANIRKMIDAGASSGEAVSLRAWAMSKGLDVRQVGRMAQGQNSVTLDTLEAVAQGCQVPAWSLLHPDFEPAASVPLPGPSQTPSLLTAEDIEFLKKLRRFMDK